MFSLLENNGIFRNIYCFISGNEGNALVCSGRDGILPGYELGTNGLAWIGFFVAGFAIMFMLANFVMLGAAIYVWTDRRLLARFQTRLGPNRVGPFGLLQPIADIIKLLSKEDIVPRVADKIVFLIAPIIFLVPVILTMAVVPFSRGTFLADLNIAVLYFVALGGIGTLAIFMAGWSSGNRYALFGAMRAVAILLSYEIPILIALVGVVLLAGSMSMVKIADSQKYIVYLLVQPIGAFVFFLGSLAEVNRAPFDVVEAESEIIAGYHIEYSGIKFALFQAAEFGAVLVTSAIIVNLFLGGWYGPFLSSQLGALWFLMKVVVVVFIFEWIRATVPRLRVDQIMSFAWKCLFPLSLINLLMTTLEVYFLRDPITGIIPTGSLWIMAGINMIAAFVCIPMFGYLIKDKLSIPRREPKSVIDFTVGEAT